MGICGGTIEAGTWNSRLRKEWGRDQIIGLGLLPSLPPVQCCLTAETDSTNRQTGRQVEGQLFYENIYGSYSPGYYQTLIWNPARTEKLSHTVLRTY